MEYAYLVWILFLFSCTNAKVDDVRQLRLQVYVNLTVPYGKTTSVVITMNKMPDYQVQLRLGTPTYLLAYCTIGKGAPKFPLIFSKCENIRSELTKLGIVPYILVDYESGYLAKINAVFWNLNDTALKLEGKEPNKPDVHMVKVIYKFEIKKPDMCVPQIKIQHCDSHESPMDVVVVRSFSTNVIFLENCNVQETYLKWSLYDLEERVTMRTFSSHSQRLVIQRSQLNYYPKYELWHNQYLIFVKGELNGIEYAARCYIKRAKEEVKAIIVGGSARTSVPNRPLIMDGSQSRDYSKLPGQKQFKSYYWNCQSIRDHNNDHCINNISTAMRFTIPANVFQMGSNYSFTLRVVSDYNAKVSSFAIQTVTMQKQDQLSVSIECLKNCAERVYNPNKKVQLEAKCHNCGQQGTVLYKWHVYGKYVMSSKMFTIHWNSDQQGLQVELLAQAADGRIGSDKLQLIKHIPPIGGTCTVEPSSGIEATTLFRFCCQNFKTKTHPLSFYFYSNLLLLINCKSCDCETFLPLDAQQIKVLICGDMLTCTELQLHVHVKAMQIGKLQIARLINTTEPVPIIRTQKANEDRFLMIAQSMASRIEHSHEALALLGTFQKVFPRSVLSLGKVANMMLTIAHRLTPINYAEHEVLTRTLTILNGIFKSIYEDDMQTLLLNQPFHNISIACITIFDMMQVLNKALIHPPQNIYEQYVEAVKSESLTQNIIDKLIYEAKSIAYELGQDISLWLTSMWQTERLYRYLNVVRQHEFQPRRTKVESESYDVNIHCIRIEPDRQYTFTSRDKVHTVYFSPKLLQSMKDPESQSICLKIISITRMLDWWTPEGKEPNEALLSVHIYTHKDNFKTEIYLPNSDITFQSHMKLFKPPGRSSTINPRSSAPQPLEMKKTVRQEERDLIFPSDDEKLLEERVANREDLAITNDRLESRSINRKDDESDNSDESDNADDGGGDYRDYVNYEDTLMPIQVDKIEFIQHVRLYRVNIMERSVVAVIFLHVSHDMKVYLSVGKPPKDLRLALKNSKCFVFANSKNKTMLIRNNCGTFSQVYMAMQIKGAEVFYNKPDLLVPSGPASFMFIFQIRNCAHWKYKEKEWSGHNCVPAFNTDEDIMCTCSVLGTYTSSVYNIESTRVPVTQRLVLNINWYLVTFYIIVVSFSTIWLIILYIWFNKRPGTTVFCDMSLRESDLHQDPHDILVYLKTGGRINSQTTATVRLVFQTVQHTELEIDIMQNPTEPLLKRNSTYVLWLRTRNIRIPTRIAVSHNNAGRYPSWFLVSIDVVDINMGLTQAFIVNRWIRTKMLILSSAMILRVGSASTVGSWCHRFRAEFETQWINWGMWRPVTGEWRESKDQIGMTRFERCSIFVCKILASVTVVSVYKVQKSKNAVVGEKERNVFATEILWMFVYSFIATIIIHIIFINLPHDRKATVSRTKKNNDHH